MLENIELPLELKKVPQKERRKRALEQVEIVDLLLIWRSTGKTIIFVTHNISESVFLSDRVCVLSSNPARLSAVVDIHLPRPRENAVLKTEEYLKTVSHTRGVFLPYHFSYYV